MITTFYPPYHFGGDAVHVYQLSNALARLGHQVVVIHCRDSFELAGQAPTPLPANHPNIEIHTLHSAWGWLSPLVTQQTGRMGFKKRAIEKILAKGDFDVIHYHNVSLVGGLEVLKAGAAIKLFTLHDYWLICPTHVMFKNREEACDQPQCFRCQLAYKRPLQFWRHRSSIERALGHIDRVLIASRFTLELHRQRGLKLAAIISPLFSQVSMIEEERTESDSGYAPAKQTRPYFLFVGRLEKLKGLQDVLPWFRSATEFDLLVAGSGDYEPELRTQARGCENIHFLGQQPGSKLRILYKNAIATVMPSLSYEISPLVMIESWSEKTPVVVRDIGALGELVRNSGGGSCFTSINSLHRQLLAIGKDKALRDQLGEAGYAEFDENLTVEKHIHRYLSLIDDISREKDHH